MFQVFAQLIELRPAPLPAVYLQIFPPLLAPTFWERSGNVPALVRLLQVRAGCGEFGISYEVGMVSFTKLTCAAARRLMRPKGCNVPAPARALLVCSQTRPH